MESAATPRRAPGAYIAEDHAAPAVRRCFHPALREPRSPSPAVCPSLSPGPAATCAARANVSTHGTDTATLPRWPAPPPRKTRGVVQR